MGRLWLVVKWTLAVVLSGAFLLIGALWLWFYLYTAAHNRAYAQEVFADVPGAMPLAGRVWNGPAAELLPLYRGRQPPVFCRYALARLDAEAPDVPPRIAPKRRASFGGEEWHRGPSPWGVPGGDTRDEGNSLLLCAETEWSSDLAEQIAAMASDPDVWWHYSTREFSGNALYSRKAGLAVTFSIGF